MQSAPLLTGKLRIVLKIAGQLLIATAIAVVSAAGLAVATDLPATDGGRVAVVFEPGTEESIVFTSIIAAGGLPIRSGLGGSVMLAEGPANGFAGRLRESGAWLVLDARAFAGCASSISGRGENI